MNKILIYGNSGTGKTTLARKKAAQFDLPYLDLDTVAWSSPGVREHEDKSSALIAQFMDENPGWVIEGCYGRMIRDLLPACSELYFLNPGISASLENNARRGWESHKYPSMEEQNAHFDMLQEWVSEYESRDDEFSYPFHREIFSSFDGKKYELTSLDGY